MLVPVSSAIVNAETAESSTLGTVISMASVVFERGMRWALAVEVLPTVVVPTRTCWLLPGEVPAFCRGTPRDGRGMGSISRSKIAELEE
jgi:hypothetical protein